MTSAPPCAPRSSPTSCRRTLICSATPSNSPQCLPATRRSAPTSRCARCRRGGHRRRCARRTSTSSSSPAPSSTSTRKRTIDWVCIDPGAGQPRTRSSTPAETKDWSHLRGLRLGNRNHSHPAGKLDEDPTHHRGAGRHSMKTICPMCRPQSSGSARPPRRGTKRHGRGGESDHRRHRRRCHRSARTHRRTVRAHPPPARPDHRRSDGHDSLSPASTPPVGTSPLRCSAELGALGMEIDT